MVSIAGSKKLKRQMAPLFWGVSRKEKRFAVTVKPGPHSKNQSVPTSIFLRDMLKIVKTLREAKSTIYGQKVKIDGVVRKSLHHGIGLMDVVELDNVSDVYRLVPMNGRILQPLKVPDTEKTKKIVKITSKTTLKGGKIQVGFHDGRVIISDKDVKVGDSCIIEVPTQKILDVIKMEKGCQGLVTNGINAGGLGTIEDIEEGTFRLKKKVFLNLGERKIEIPINIVMAVGKEKPAITVR
ncbi:MAG: 30S ribosomal protein S4e [Nitrosopumilaceae archaeon]|nr:30S ribosomal protein S4e [Nitrosopumilaceae archaeon]NIU02524.1 30S ribosomal protein S4e [Nitrosopumilaceae archaeon]NIU88985.1 30S ribosomal protein S4e [Nitrosopumilaceae archaeon]NIV67096.1 30S ribosomal protein S4e [Nitrosopumilaceae archaeon]NIX63125.1 30S ribosomal protein S4e [Nitrosopumilaceae archaeon]